MSSPGSTLVAAVTRVLPRRPRARLRAADAGALGPGAEAGDSIVGPMAVGWRPDEPGAGARPRSPLALSAAGKAAEAVPLLLLVTVVPRVLGPDDYGRVALAVALVTLGSAALSLGGPALLTRFVPAAEPARRAAVARALARRLAVWRGIQAALLAVAAVVLVVLVPETFDPFTTVVVAVALCLDVAATLCFQVALALGRDAAWTFRYALQSTVLVAAVLALAAAGSHDGAVVGVALAAGAALVVGLAVVARPLLEAERGVPVEPETLRFARLQGLGGFCAQVLHRGGVPAVALLAGSATETGFAGLSIGIALAATYGIWQAFAIQLPRLAARATADLRAALVAAEHLAWRSLLLVAPPAVVAAMFLDPVLPLLAGERFRAAEAALGPALAVVPLAPLTALTMQTAALRLRADVRLGASAAGAAVFLAVAGAAVPHAGAAGATSALLAGTVATALASLALLHRSASQRVALGSIGAAALALGTAEVSRGGGASSLLLATAAVAVSVALGVLALRRLAFLVAAMLPASRPPDGVLDASVTLLLAARDEAGYVEQLLDAIERLDYPRDRLSVVLVDDGSNDETGDILARWAEGRPGATVLRLPRRCGKPVALNRGLLVAPPSDLVAICDADQKPQPDSLRRVVAEFADETVGAAGAYLRPVNANAGVVARYAAVETWVTQLVTSAARNRLNLNPPMLGGGSVYRRRALEQIGGFPEELTSEDAHASIALTRHGWRTRFVREAVVENRVVEHWRPYWHQHVRWARAGYHTIRLQRGRGASVGRRIEAWMVSANYADRLALLGAVGLAAAGALPVWVPAGYLGVVGLAVIAGVARGGAIRHLPLFLAATAAMLLLDAAATVYANVAQLRRRPLEWHRPRGAARPGPQAGAASPEGSGP